MKLHHKDYMCSDTNLHAYLVRPTLMEFATSFFRVLLVPFILALSSMCARNRHSMK